MADSTLQSESIFLAKSDVVSVHDYPLGTVDGYSSNQSGLVAAAAANQGGRVHVPDGVYVSTDTIPGFHNVTWYGSGVIIRGASIFHINQDAGQLNIVHVANEGSDENDGLTPDQPMQTILAAATTLLIKWPENLLLGAWRIQLAAGRYRRAAVLKHLFNAERVQVFGPAAEWDEPSAHIDNVDKEDNVIGLYLNGLARLHVKDVRFSGFTGTHGQGLVASQSQDLYAENVHADNCGWAGINMSPGGVIRVSGGKVTDCREGIRTYSGTTFSIGYNSQANPTVIENCTMAGFTAHNASNGHVDYAEISGCTVAALMSNQSRIDFAGARLMGNRIAISADTSSTYIKNTPEDTLFNSGAPNTLNERCRGFSLPHDFIDKFTFNPVTRQSLSGVGWSGASAFSTYKYVFEQQPGDSGIALLAADNALSTLAFGRPGHAAAGRITYDHSVDWIRLIAGSTVIYYMNASTFRPSGDGSASSGAASARWSVVHSVTGAINTADENVEQQIRPIDAACLRAWRNVEYVQYKINDAVHVKGDGARWHFGVIAQRVRDAFAAEGLDAFDYGLLCYDEWEAEPAKHDEEGLMVAPPMAAGRRYGIRYEEALALECAYLRGQLNSDRPGDGPDA